jgi:hypothetical protein
MEAEIMEDGASATDAGEVLAAEIHLRTQARSTPVRHLIVIPTCYSGNLRP